MTTTPIMGLPELEQDQAQPHIPVNMAHRIIECLAQLSVLDRDLTTPPSSPAEGDCYIVASGASDEWANHDGEVAMYIGGAWVFRAPRVGWEAYVIDEQTKVRYEDLGSYSDWVIV